MLVGFSRFAANTRKYPYLINPNNPTKMIALLQTDVHLPSVSCTGVLRHRESSGMENMTKLGSDHQYCAAFTGLNPNTRYHSVSNLEGSRHT